MLISSSDIPRWIHAPMGGAFVVVLQLSPPFPGSAGYTPTPFEQPTLIVSALLMFRLWFWTASSISSARMRPARFPMCPALPSPISRASPSQPCAPQAPPCIHVYPEKVVGMVALDICHRSNSRLLTWSMNVRCRSALTLFGSLPCTFAPGGACPWMFDWVGSSVQTGTYGRTLLQDTP